MIETISNILTGVLFVSALIFFCKLIQLLKREKIKKMETEDKTLLKYDDKGLDCFSYHELMDRSFVIHDMICEYLKHHLVYNSYPALKTEVDKASDRLLDIYQMASYLESKRNA